MPGTHVEISRAGFASAEVSVVQSHHRNHTANGCTSLPTAMTWRRCLFILSGCADVSPRITPRVEAPWRILTGFSGSRKSAYSQRLTTSDVRRESWSNTRAHVLGVICPVTGVTPTGRDCHLCRSTEYLVAAEDVFVGTAPPGDDGARNAQSGRRDELQTAAPIIWIVSVLAL
jgi:hypothetical protein